MQITQLAVLIAILGLASESNLVSAQPRGKGKRGGDGKRMKKFQKMAEEKFDSYFEMKQSDREDLARDGTKWDQTLTKLKTEHQRMVQYMQNATQEMRKKNGPSFKKGDRVNMLGSNEPCNYNFQCETECCLEPRKRSRKGGKGKKGDRDDRQLQSFPGKDQAKGKYQSHDWDTDIGSKICVAEKRCDDDDSDEGYTIWQFFAGLIMGGLCIAVIIQGWFFRKEVETAKSRASGQNGPAFQMGQMPNVGVNNQHTQQPIVYQQQQPVAPTNGAGLTAQQQQDKENNADVNQMNA